MSTKMITKLVHRRPDYVLGGGPVVVEFRTDNTIWSTISNRDYGTNGTITLDGNNMLSDPSFSWNPKMPASICGTADGAGCTLEGNVFLRAKSQCANMIAAPEYSSEITGYLDFLRPNLFGDVLPLDHHYELGDEIKLRWSDMETTAASESSSQWKSRYPARSMTTSRATAAAWPSWATNTSVCRKARIWRPTSPRSTWNARLAFLLPTSTKSREARGRFPCGAHHDRGRHRNVSPGLRTPRKQHPQGELVWLDRSKLSHTDVLPHWATDGTPSSSNWSPKRLEMALTSPARSERCRPTPF